LDVGFLGDAVTVNSIKLRFNLVLGGTSLTVNPTHPIQVTLFFTRATRGEWIVIHEATLADRPHFMRMYPEFQKDQHEKGSYFLPSTHNLSLAKNMFETYATGSVDGFCLLWIPESEGEPVAFLLAGADVNPNRWELDLGRLASLWAVYVQPTHRGQGISMKLFDRAMQMGLGMGVDSIVTYVLTTNPHGERVALEFGTKPVLVEHHVRLREALTSPEGQASLQRGTT
jgi:GNAT superfamily N-acetyltransferase